MAFHSISFFADQRETVVTLSFSSSDDERIPDRILRMTAFVRHDDREIVVQSRVVSVRLIDEPLRGFL